MKRMLIYIMTCLRACIYPGPIQYILPVLFCMACEIYAKQNWRLIESMTAAYTSF